MCKDPDVSEIIVHVKTVVAGALKGREEQSEVRLKRPDYRGLLRYIKDFLS